MFHAEQSAPADTKVVMVDLLSFVPYYTGHLCAALRAKRGLCVTLASITYQHDREFFRRQGIRNDPGLLDVTYRLSFAPAPFRRALKVIEYLINLSALLVRLAVAKPAVVHIQFLPLVGLGLPMECWFLQIVRKLGIHVVYTVHNLLPQDGGDRCRPSFHRIYHLADRLICHDAEVGARLTSDFGVSPGRVRVIPHGPMFGHVPTNPVEQAREKLGFPPGKCVVLWQGILRPYKGISFLLQAWKQVCAVDARALLAIVGTGDEDMVTALHKAVVALGIQSRVRLDLRFVSVEELADYYQAADILVYPYREITTSGALMTGIVHGKAVIATALPAFEQLIRDDETGLLVPYGDTNRLSQCLLRLIAEPGLGRDLGARLKASHAHMPGWAEIAEQTYECYQGAILENWIGATQAVRT